MQARKVDYNWQLGIAVAWYLLRKWLTKGKNFRRYQKVHVSGLESRVSSDVSKIPSRDQSNFLKFPNALRDAIWEFKPRSFGMLIPYFTLTPSTKAPCESAHSFSPLVSKTINLRTGTGTTKGSFTINMLAITTAFSESNMRLFVCWGFLLNTGSSSNFFWNNSHRKLNS